MEIFRTDDFDRVFKKLPKEIQRLYQVQERRFKDNRHDSRLHIKKIRTLPFALSFRITRNYRVLFYFQNREKAIFFFIDHGKDVYRR